MSGLHGQSAREPLTTCRYSGVRSPHHTLDLAYGGSPKVEAFLRGGLGGFALPAELGRDQALYKRILFLSFLVFLLDFVCDKKILVGHFAAHVEALEVEEYFAVKNMHVGVVVVFFKKRRELYDEV